MEGSRAKGALLVLCGLPGSGKSTIAKEIREHVIEHRGRFEESGPRCEVEIVTFDDWLHPELLAGQFSADTWHRSRQAALSHLLGALERVQSHESLGVVHTLIIADDNHHLRSMRYELFRAARDRGSAFLQLFLPCSPEAALSRNAARSGVAAVPPDALLRMAAALEPPQPERFAWEATSLSAAVAATAAPVAMAVAVSSAAGAAAADGEAVAADGRGGSGDDVEGNDGGSGAVQQATEEESPCVGMGSEQQRRERQEQEEWSGCSGPGEQWERTPLDTVAAVCAALWRMWGPPPPPPPSEAELLRQREAGRAANAASQLHALDLRSRRALGAAVAAAPPAGRAAIARDLNERRRALLAAARELLQSLPLPPSSPEADGSCGGDGGNGNCTGESGGGSDGCGGGGGGVGGSEDAGGGCGVVARLRELETAFIRAAGQLEEEGHEGG